MYVVLHIQSTTEEQYYPKVGSDNKFHFNFTVLNAIKIHSVVLKSLQSDEEMQQLVHEWLCTQSKEFFH
jgi:hypothetical protein